MTSRQNKARSKKKTTADAAVFVVMRRAQQCRPQAVCRQTTVTRALRSARGCNMNRHAEDSWRSHVHRTYTAQRVQSFKLQTANVGGRGERPSSFSGGYKGGILFEKRIPPLYGSGAKSRTIHAAPAALHPPSPAREIKKGYPLREENTPFAWPIQISILTPCVSMVMMLPAMATPSRMTGTARFRRISSTAAMSAPVHAPVPGSGMATKSSSPHV